jgi:hypothetical protein
VNYIVKNETPTLMVKVGFVDPLRRQQMKESVVARWCFVMVVIVVGMLGCTPSVRQTSTATVPPSLAERTPFKEAAVQEIGPFNYEHRLTIYQKINQLTKRLLSCRPRSLSDLISNLFKMTEILTH